jgi:biopolymer transport protein ExbB
MFPNRINTSTILGTAAATLKDMIGRPRQKTHKTGRARRAAAVIVAMLGLGLSASPAFAWWDKDWGSRKQITLDTSASAGSVDGAVSNFPVLLRLDSSSFNFDDASANGADIRFVSDDDKTVLPAHIESFNAKDGIAAIWVAMPSLPAGGQQKVWMYFGNKKAAPADAQILDPLYKAVYHFGAGETVATDATPAHANANTVPHEHAGWIGEAASFNGTTTLNLPALSIDPNQGFSFEAWIKSANGNGTLYANGDLTIGLENGVPFVSVGGTKSNPVPALGSGWSYIAVTGDAKGVTLYVNGIAATTVATPLPALSGAGVVGTGFTGAMDEVRISGAARPAAYVKASYSSQMQGSRLAAYGPTEQPAGGGLGYFSVIFSNITPDAWVVIAILCIMAVMSWIVMVERITYVTRTRKANAVFMSMYNRLRGDVMNMETQFKLTAANLKQLGQSSLYRIYKLGVHELKVRQEEDGNHPLAEETLEAIKATLDAAQIEEVQALDKGVVLLTISIAGGPFIGLLGTVLGVMITFASIALAGDVNVNAIAPGIAAALLATVTGLAVAIPALFGYNYISTQNSDVIAKTQIFGDRLITRFAELQRRHHILRAAE